MSIEDSRRLQNWLLIPAALIAVLLFVVPAGWWPWDHDEVHSLVELGLVPLDAFPGPVAQMERMHRLVPMFYAMQHAAVLFLPQNEWGMRLLSSICGALVTLVAFSVGARVRGTWFAAALFVLLAGSQTMVWLAQQNRFYSLALLFMVVALALEWWTGDSWLYDGLAVAAAVAAVLSHNLTLIMFGLSAVALTATWLVGWTPRTPVRRAGLVLIATAAVYVFYLRPLTAGWMSGNTGGTSPLLSFVAQAGMTPLALALPGCVAVLNRKDAPFWSSWVLLAALGVGFVAVSPRILGNWNPRYGLFFMVPIWWLAAMGCDAIMRRLESNQLRLACLLAVAALHAPKLASHYVDGSRHDFRTAAAVVAAKAPGAGTVLTNWPAELQYYLSGRTSQRPRYWAPGETVPDEETVIVLASNGWEPVFQLPGREVRVIGEVGRRRFDEQAHIIRVYDVAARRQ